MPEKPSQAEYLRRWREKNPDKCKAYADRLADIKRRLGTRRKELSTAHLVNTLGDPVQPTQKHVVLSRLLRRLLLEGWNRGYLYTARTQDDSGYEFRVKAALAVSKCVASKEDNTNKK